MNDHQIITQEAAGYTEEQRRLITDVLCKGATEEEVAFFMQVAQRCRLDPFRKQIYATKRYDSTLRREVLTYQVGIDGFRALAARTGEYVGNDDPVFELDANGFPIKASCTVYRNVRGAKAAFTASVWYDESVQTTREGKPNSMWQKRPKGQLGKCAEAAALRKGFPEDTGGLHIEEEMPDPEQEATIKPEGTRSVAQAEPRSNRGSFVHSIMGRAAKEGNLIIADNDPAVIEHWSELYPSGIWRQWKMPEHSQWAGMTMQDISRLGGKTWQDVCAQVDASEYCRLAIDCGRFASIEQAMAASGITAEALMAECVTTGAMPSGQTFFDATPQQLTLITGILHAMRQRQAEANKPQ